MEAICEPYGSISQPYFLLLSPSGSAMSMAPSDHYKCGLIVYPQLVLNMFKIVKMCEMA